MSTEVLNYLPRRAGNYESGLTLRPQATDNSIEADTHVDYLTVTTRIKRIGDTLLDIYDGHKSGETSAVKFFGFDCLRCKSGLAWGLRAFDNRYILIAPGDVAGPVWEKLYAIPVKVTRIDLACDVWLETPRDQVKNSARLPMCPEYDTRITATLIRGVKGGKRGSKGDTLYLGSRSSEQFGRMYDKGLQTNTTPPGVWFRYEVEYKAGAARQIAKAARVLLPGQLGEWIRCTIFDWYIERAVVPLFLRETDTPGTKIRSQMAQTTEEKKLVWLSTQVKPTVQYLFEQGMRDKTLAALGVEIVNVEADGYNIISRGVSVRGKNN